MISNYRIAMIAVMAFAAVGAATVGVSSHAQAAPPALAKDSNAAKKKTRAARGMLVVRAKFLGRAKKPTVRVVGRSAPKRPVKLGTRLRLRAGTYTLVTAPVKTARGTRYTVSKRIKVRVRAKKTTRATLRYRVLVPARTRVVPVAAARKMTRVTDTSLRMPAAYAKALKKGSIIAAGVTPATPDGLLRKVVAKKITGGKATLTTVPATLQEAVPEGEFSVRVAEDGTITGGEMDAHSSLTHREHAAKKLGHTFVVEQAMGASGVSGCTGQGEIRHTVKVPVSMALATSAKWNLFNTKLDFDLDGSLGLDYTAAGSISAVCSKEVKGFKMTLGRIVFPVGPVPVVLVPELSTVAKFSVSGGAEGSVTTGANVKAGFGFTYDDGRVKWRNRGSNNGYARMGLGGVGSVSVSAGPRFEVKLYGIAGPNVTAPLGVEVGLTKDQWTADGTAKIEAGARFDLLGMKLQKSTTILGTRWRLADGTFGQGGGGQSPNPSERPDGARPDPAPGSPDRVALKKVTSLTSGGYAHMCAVHDEGRLACWGFQAYGWGHQPLSPTSSGRVAHWPVAATSFTDITQAVAGMHFTCVLRRGGSVWCWGYNESGQLGQGYVSPYSGLHVPVKVAGIEDAISITSEGTSACAVRRSGAVYCWGRNDFGSGWGDFPTPFEIPGLHGAEEVTLAYARVCGRRQNEGFVCLPSLGFGIDQQIVPGTKSALAISLGVLHGCAVKDVGTVACWGDNRWGQRGNGTIDSGDGTDQNPNGWPPATVAGLASVRSIVAGDFSACALHTGGTVSCWGNNEYGVLGDQTTNPSGRPLTVPGVSDAVGLGQSDYVNCAIRENGRVSCWGRSDSLGNGGTTAEPSGPVLVG